MNKEEDVELLEATSIDSSVNTQSISTIEVPSGMEVPVDNVSGSSISSMQKDSSLNSPFSSNSAVTGTNANSPRIAPESTFAATKHSMNQQTVPNMVPKSDLGEAKPENSSSNSFNMPNSTSINPAVAGTNANSPRIAPESTFAATKHGMKQPNMVSKQEGENPNMGEALTSKQGELSSNPGKTPNSNSTKPVFLIVAFVLLLATIFLLPYSQDLFDKFFSKDKGNEIIDNVTEGNLVCTMESDDAGNSYQYTEIYSFHDSKVDSLEHKVLIQGDADYLKQRNNQCLLLQQNASSVSGVTVDCDLSNEEMLETQTFIFEKFNLENVTTSFSEAGGVYPNASQGDDYKEVQRMVEISGYDCKIR